MKKVFLVNYSVKGIKTLDKWLTLSFYKKTITKEVNIQSYNVKGIYGMNGSGKSGIITSVDILRNILINPEYLNNPIVQKNLDALINKKLEELSIEADFMIEVRKVLTYFRYKVTLKKNKFGKYLIFYEHLSSKRATSKVDSMATIFEVKNGEIVTLINKDSQIAQIILQKTINLLQDKSMSALFFEKGFIFEIDKDNEESAVSSILAGLVALLLFGKRTHVYLDKSDDHRGYFVWNSLQFIDEAEENDPDINTLVKHISDMDIEHLNVLDVSGNLVAKEMYKSFEEMVADLYEFIHIFKSDLINIEIDRKEDHEEYVCHLIMVYDSYKIHAEFESTGIKKLIELYAYLREMVQGSIVFIDEFDSNLHDVYLCALLEYLMSYAKGQLCFTTHNVGPMDILKQNKKSIDFLSTDGNIYPWIKNGHYSPSKLYKNGMIEGSPFNIDSIDFIGIFGSSREDE